MKCSSNKVREPTSNYLSQVRKHQITRAEKEGSLLNHLDVEYLYNNQYAIPRRRNIGLLDGASHLDILEGSFEGKL